jgi:hypothetical protein
MSGRQTLTVPLLEIGGGVEPFARTTIAQVGPRIEDVLQGLQQVCEVLCGVRLARLLVDLKDSVQHLSRTVHPLKVDPVLVRLVHQFEAASVQAPVAPDGLHLVVLLSFVYTSAKFVARVLAPTLCLCSAAQDSAAQSSPDTMSRDLLTKSAEPARSGLGCQIALCGRTSLQSLR